MSTSQHTTSLIQNLLYMQLSTLDLFRKLSTDSQSTVLQQIIDCKSSRLLDFSNELKRTLFLSGESVAISIQFHNSFDPEKSAIEEISKQELNLALRYSTILKCNEVPAPIHNLLAMQYETMSHTIANSRELMSEVA